MSLALGVPRVVTKQDAATTAKGTSGESGLVDMQSDAESHHLDFGGAKPPSKFHFIKYKNRV